MRIAIDSGGTFTDCISFDRGVLKVAKVFSTPANPSDGILTAIHQAAPSGDSISVRHGTTVGTNALLERKGFSSADFRLYHPGGRLGRRLLRVRDIMHQEDEVPLVPPNAPMSDAILVMTAKSFGCVGVCGTDGRLVGVITDGDLRRHMGDSLLRQTVGAVMHLNPKTIAPTALAADALGVMNRFAITSLFVVDEGRRPVGFLHMHDCLRAGIA